MDKSPLKTSLFVWEGINKQGYHLRGEYNANNKKFVRSYLLQQDVKPLKIYKKPLPSAWSQRSKINPSDITVFCRQLSTLITSSVPLLQAFDIIIQGQEKRKMQEMLRIVQTDIAQGKSLASSLRKHKKYFDDLICNLINVGEESGSLDVLLEQIATYKEKVETTKKKIKKALFYPAAIVTIALLVTVILLIFVVPQFQDLFKSFDKELPIFTRFVLGVSNYIQHNWWLILIGITLFLFGFITLKRRYPPFAYATESFILNIPVIGPILRKAIISRITRTLGITLAAGIPLVNAFTSIAGIAGNQVYRDAIFQVRDEVATGQSICDSLRKLGLFPALVVQMIAIGEQSGTLENILNKIASFYEEDVDNAVDSLSSLLEPLIMIFLGVVIGGLVAAMYLPIFKLGSLF